jgi:prohibitin 1
LFVKFAKIAGKLILNIQNKTVISQQRKNKMKMVNEKEELTVWGKFLVFGTIAAVFLLATCVTYTSNGHVKVISSFGHVHERTLDPGLNFVLPWQTTHSLKTLTVKEDEEAEVPTSERLTVKIGVKLNYSIERDKVHSLYRKYGGNHLEVAIVPNLQAALRNCALNYKAEELYSAKKEVIEESIESHLRKSLSEQGIVIEQILLTDLIPPATIKERIEAKMAAEQEAKRMEYVVQKETQEAERKRVEAKGIADAQQIIKKDLDDNYIRYLWILALKEHKGAIIYVPTGNDGLPFFKKVHEPGQ